MAIFRFSRWRLSAILDFQTEEILMADWLWGPRCITVPIFINIDQMIVEIW